MAQIQYLWYLSVYLYANYPHMLYCMVHAVTCWANQRNLFDSESEPYTSIVYFLCRIPTCKLVFIVSEFWVTYYSSVRVNTCSLALRDSCDVIWYVGVASCSCMASELCSALGPSSTIDPSNLLRHPWGTLMHPISSSVGFLHTKLHSYPAQIQDSNNNHTHLN